MGREVRRVALDFDWPLGQPWQGFLLPPELSLPDCPTCHGRGDTPTMRWLRAITDLLLMLDRPLVGDGSALHPYLRGLMNQPDRPDNRATWPDHDEARLLTAGLINADSPGRGGAQRVGRLA